MDDQQPVMQVDETFLEQLGLGALTSEAKESLLNYVREELQLRVGVALSDNLSDEQIDEFEQLMASGADQQTSAEWLGRNCPNYQEVVRSEIEKMRQELAQNREAILNGATPDQDAA